MNKKESLAEILQRNDENMALAYSLNNAKEYLPGSWHLLKTDYGYKLQSKPGNSGEISFLCKCSNGKIIIQNDLYKFQEFVRRDELDQLHKKITLTYGRTPKTIALTIMRLLVPTYLELRRKIDARISEHEITA